MYECTKLGSHFSLRHESEKTAWEERTFLIMKRETPTDISGGTIHINRLTPIILSTDMNISLFSYYM